MGCFTSSSMDFMSDDDVMTKGVWYTREPSWIQFSSPSFFHLQAGSLCRFPVGVTGWVVEFPLDSMRHFLSLSSSSSFSLTHSCYGLLSLAMAFIKFGGYADGVGVLGCMGELDYIFLVRTGFVFLGTCGLFGGCGKFL